ncbi:MAG: insulinase family protein, partial [Bacteroidales bacterium]|nr:insulinase family protein [Bacteroidales bacterium]
RMLAGKKVSVDVNLSETVEEIGGTSTPKDFETMMQLIYLRFAKPRFDAMAHKSYMERLMSSYDNLVSSPDLIMNDSLSLITTNYSNRTAIFNRETLSTVTLNDVEKIYRDRFNGADEFTFIIVGNVDEETVIPMVEKYIGSIPKTNRTETYVDRKIGQPKGKVDKNIELDLAIPKATVYLSYEKDMPVIPYNSLGLSVLNGILDIVYTETVREKEGGTYGVSVSLSTHRTPSQRAEGYIAFECDPNRADELKAIVYDELNKIIKKGPSQENLNKTVLNILKNREESKLHNSYWTSILLIYDRFGIDNNSSQNYEDVLKSFTPKDIKKVAKKMFKKSNVVDIVFSPTN